MRNQLPDDLRAPLSFFRMPHLHLEGTGHEIGRAIGGEFKHMVRWTIHSYIAIHRGSPHERAFGDYVERAHALFSEHRPEAVDEMRGIADGADVDWRLVLAANGLSSLNAFVERTVSTSATGAGSTQCSNLMLPDSEVGPLLGATLDCAPTRLLATIDPEDGYRATYPVWPGLVLGPWGGMNERGLAFAGASVPAHSQHDALTGLERLSPNRRMLHRCADVDDALAFLQAYPMPYEHNMSLLDSTGHGRQVHGRDPRSGELRTRELASDQGLACGNVYPWEADREDIHFPNEQAVHSRLNALRRVAPPFSLEAIEKVLTSHDGDPAKCESVCNFGNNVAMIAAPAHRKLWFATRPACPVCYTQFGA